MKTVIDTHHHLFQKLPVDLGNLPLTDWDEFFEELGFSFTLQKKIFNAVFFSPVDKLSSLPGLTKEEKEILNKTAVIHRASAENREESKDGSHKISLRLYDGHLAEALLLPEWNKGKLSKCAAVISSQIGCFFGCSFCATGKMGFLRNLTTDELLAQIRETHALAMDQWNHPLTHIYFNGMGEPLHNYRAVSNALSLMKEEKFPAPPHSNIIVSTVGLHRQIRMLAREHPDVQLSVSIHSADQKIRWNIMPVSARLGLPEIQKALLYHHHQTGNPVTIQYLLLRDINDRIDDAEKLAAYLKGLKAKITLIVHNYVEKSEYRPPEKEKMEKFQNIIEASGFETDIRWCYGSDINAGCGQLNRPSSEERISISMRHPENTSSGRL